MANPAHVALVQQGADAINAWREAHPDTPLDLEKADLPGINLRGANLQGARLHEACLQEADLWGANLQHTGLRETQLRGARLQHARLQHARLIKANLEQADLQGARLYKAHLHGAYVAAANLQQANLQGAYLLWTYLVGAHLGGAYLQRADLQWANLQEANLAGAHLHEANLQESVLGNTVFDHTHLHGAHGLDTCRPQGPSALDLGTLAQSGPLPEPFLRGCGWPEALLAHTPERLSVRRTPLVIERSLVFPPALQQAGLGLLSYVATFLRQYCPDVVAAVCLVQDGPLVRLLIEAPAAQRDTAEQALQAYGLFVAGQKAPEDVLVDPSHIRQLQQKLAVVDTELHLSHAAGPQAEPPGASPPAPVARAFLHLRQLLGRALYEA